MAQINNVLVLFGGVSTEHKVSCRSAYAIIKGLQAAGYNVKAIGITLDGEWIPFKADLKYIRSENWLDYAKKALEKEPLRSISSEKISSPRYFIKYLCDGISPDLVYLALHGINGEDGAIQGFLEICGLPYIGSNVFSSALCMDKVYTKLVLNNSDIPQLDFAVVRRSDLNHDHQAIIKDIESKFSYPIFLKPANGGSSVGTTKVNSREELKSGLKMVLEFDSKALIEPFYPSREIEVACLGNDEVKVASPGEIMKSKGVEYYDYETKYADNAAGLDIPAKLKPETINKLQTYAQNIYKMMSCEGLARVDFFVSEDESEIYFNEINTLPGFTSISLYPSAWDAAGKDIATLLKEICELAIDAHIKSKRKIDV